MVTKAKKYGLFFTQIDIFWPALKGLDLEIIFYFINACREMFLDNFFFSFINKIIFWPVWSVNWPSSFFNLLVFLITIVGSLGHIYFFTISSKGFAGQIKNFHGPQLACELIAHRWLEICFMINGRTKKYSNNV